MIPETIYDGNPGGNVGSCGQANGFETPLDGYVNFGTGIEYAINKDGEIILLESEGNIFAYKRYNDDYCGINFVSDVTNAYINVESADVTGTMNMTNTTGFMCIDTEPRELGPFEQINNFWEILYYQGESQLFEYDPRSNLFSNDESQKTYNKDVYFLGHSEYIENDEDDQTSYADGTALFAIGHINVESGILQSFYFAEELGVRGFFVPDETNPDFRQVDGMYYYSHYIIDQASGAAAQNHVENPTNDSLDSLDNLVAINKRLTSINILPAISETSQIGTFNYSPDSTFDEKITFNFDFTTSESTNSAYTIKSLNQDFDQNKKSIISTIKSDQGSNYISNYRIVEDISYDNNKILLSELNNPNTANTNTPNYTFTEQPRDLNIIAVGNDVRSVDYFGVLGLPLDNKVKMFSSKERDSQLLFQQGEVDKLNITQETLIITGVQDSVVFGHQVKMLTQLDQDPEDGEFQVVVADPGYANNRGAVYVYDICNFDFDTDTQPTRFISQVFSGDNQGDEFGFSIDLKFNKNQTSGAMLVVGAPGGDYTKIYQFTGHSTNINNQFDENKYKLTNYQQGGGLNIKYDIEQTNAGYNNTWGYYLTKENSSIPESGQIIETGVKDRIEYGEFLIQSSMIETGVNFSQRNIGYFLVPDGSSLNQYINGQTIFFEEHKVTNKKSQEIFVNDTGEPQHAKMVMEILDESILNDVDSFRLKNQPIPIGQQENNGWFYDSNTKELEYISEWFVIPENEITKIDSLNNELEIRNNTSISNLHEKLSFTRIEGNNIAIGECKFESDISHTSDFSFESNELLDGELTYSGVYENNGVNTRVETAEQHILFSDKTINASGQFNAVKFTGCASQKWEDVIFSTKPWYQNEPDYDDLIIHSYITNASSEEWVLGNTFSHNQAGYKFGEHVAISYITGSIVAINTAVGYGNTSLYYNENNTWSKMTNRNIPGRVSELDKDGGQLYVGDPIDKEFKVYGISGLK